jgi:hypothetical protein
MLLASAGISTLHVRREKAAFSRRYCAASPAAVNPMTQPMKTIAQLKDAHWSLTSLREKLIKIGAKVVSRRYVAFQMAEVPIPRNLFAEILRLIAELRPSPIASTA